MNEVLWDDAVLTCCLLVILLDYQTHISSKENVSKCWYKSHIKDALLVSIKGFDIVPSVRESLVHEIFLFRNCIT